MQTIGCGQIQETRTVVASRVITREVQQKAPEMIDSPTKIRKQTRQMEQREFEGVVNKGEREIRVSGKAAEIRMDYINVRHLQRKN